MNFLSHFYFDRTGSSSEKVIGTVLPDLVKNAKKDWILHPYRVREKLIEDVHLNDLFEGWNRHLLVDKYFHCSEFFISQTHNLRLKIAPIPEISPIRPSFVAHIGLELMLDSLLITEGMVNPDAFYRHLSEGSRTSLNDFLLFNNISEPAPFFSFYDDFIKVAYLKEYGRTSSIMYSVNRICLRIWSAPFTEMQKRELTEIFEEYKEELKKEFLTIFKEIEDKLKK
jgi:hypothetical protein